MKKNLLILGFSLVLFSFGSKSKSETSSTPQYLKDYNAGVRAQNEKDYPAAIEFYQRSLD